MKRTAGELAQFLGGVVDGVSGESIEGVAELDSAGHGDLSYAEPRYLDRVDASQASCVLVSEGEFPGTTTIQVSNPKAAFARAANWLIPPVRPKPGVHPTAVVSEGVQLGERVHVGAHAVIEDDVVIGNDTVVYPGCHIASQCRIGEGCTIRTNVVLYPGVEIGNRVVLHAGVVVGSDGFGYVRDADEYVQFPQLGRIRIEDEVEIGANSAVDRGSLGSTLIGRGTKLDNLVHVAHNVRIGARTVIAAQTGVSGSCDIGDDAVIAGQVGIADHVRIDSGAVVGAQCGIPSGKRIRAGRVFWGTPARPLDDIKIQQAHISRLPKMAAELARLKQLVEQLAGEKKETD
jgi:UDP-3-O-[3-hydroxymyristoyl] glucosamine N-acyltransferase